MAFVLGLAAGLAIALLTRAVETSRVAFGPFALYGNGALVVPGVGVPFALFALWSWVLRWRRSRAELVWSAVGLHLGLGMVAVLGGGLSPASIPGLLFTGLVFVVPVAVIAYLVYAAFASNRIPTSAGVLTALVLVGLMIAAVLSPLGSGLITAAFLYAATRARPPIQVWLGGAMALVLVAGAFAAPLLLQAAFAR